MSYNYQEAAFYQQNEGTVRLSGQEQFAQAQNMDVLRNGQGFSISSQSRTAPYYTDNTGSIANSESVNQIAQDLYQINRVGTTLESDSTQRYVSTQQQSSSIYLSAIEQAILRSNVPIEVNESENITVNFAGKQETGLWTNRSEVINWRGIIPITEYVINEDMNPEVITKQSEQQLVYIQELAIRYLRPPTPPAPGEIIIQQEMNTLTPPAPPLVIRQLPARASTPEPLVIREAPPQPPAAVGRKVITISGKRIPPAPRKVVIERLAPLPSKPQSVLVERWLPYSQVKRRVIFQRSAQAEAVVIKPRNVIVQWAPPKVVIKKEFKYLGVIRANPVEYVQRYGATLKMANELPDFVLDIKTPEGLVLAADYHYNAVHELEGDVKAMGFIDLEREGLTEYRSVLNKMGITYVGASQATMAASQYKSTTTYSATNSASFGAAYATSGSSAIISGEQTMRVPSRNSSREIIDEIFASIDLNNSGKISVDEAARVLLKLNSRLGRSYGEDESQAFFQVLDVNHDGELSLSEFRAAFERLL